MLSGFLPEVYFLPNDRSSCSSKCMIWNKLCPIFTWPWDTLSVYCVTLNLHSVVYCLLWWVLFSNWVVHWQMRLRDIFFEHRWEHSVLSRCDLVSYLHTIACHNRTKKQHVWQRKLANHLPSTKSCCGTDLLHSIDSVGTFCAESGRAAKWSIFFSNADVMTLFWWPIILKPQE